MGYYSGFSDEIGKDSAITFSHERDVMFIKKKKTDKVVMDKIQKRLNEVVREKMSGFQRWLHGYVTCAIWVVLHKGHS